MLGIITTAKDVSKNWNIYDKYSENLHLRNKKKAKLINENPEYKLREEKVKGKAEAVINAVKIMDNSSENYAENIEMALNGLIGFAGLALELPLLIAGTKTKSKSKSLVYFMLALLPTFLLATLLAPLEAKMQIRASRLGRNKAIKEQLNDVNNFVSYTPEQIKKATEIVEENSENNTTKKLENKYRPGFIKFIQTEAKNQSKEKTNLDPNSNQSFKESLNQIKNFSKDYKEYKAEKENEIGINEEFQAKLDKNYSSDEIQKANEDKELILHASRIINNKAEDYSENVENAFNTLNTLETILLYPVMLLVDKIIGALSSKQNAAINKSIGSLVTVTFMMTLLMAGTSAQKNASRVGRYKAQQDLKKDISPIVYFDDKELDSAGEVKNDYKKVGSFKKIFNNLKFLKTYFKDLKEFNNYKKTDAKKEKQIFEELKKLEKTPEQIKEAENLQKKTFFAFKEIDEMSQSYSENMEVVTNLAGSLLSIPFSLGPTLLIYLGAYQLVEGTLNIPKIGKILSNLTLDKNSVIRTSLNELYQASIKDKSIKKLINQALNNNNDKKIKAIEELLKNEKTKEPLSKLMTHLEKILPELNNNLEGTIRNEVKKNKFSNYLINLGKDVLNFITFRKKRAINRLKKANKYTPNVKDDFLMNIRKQIQQNGKAGKTLKNTLIIGGIPVLSLIVLIPFAIQSIFTNIQKKSGRIGVMKATNTLDKPEYFT